MSRIGKKAVLVPSGATATIADRTVKVKGPKGELDFRLPAPISATYEESHRSIHVVRKGDDRPSRALHGMSRAMIANMVRGVTQGYERRLLIFGTGYGCSLAGKQLNLNCGFMGRGGKNKPQFVIDIPAGIQVEVEVAAARGDNEPAKLVVRGCDRQLVGQFAANIRRIRPPEPYKGKGIRYEDEFVRRKQDKAVTGAGA